MISIRDVSFSYYGSETDRWALRNIHLDIAPDEFVAFWVLMVQENRLYPSFLTASNGQRKVPSPWMDDLRWTLRSFLRFVERYRLYFKTLKTNRWE